MDTFVTIIIAIIGTIVGEQFLRIGDWAASQFAVLQNRELSRQLKRLKGTWDATEVFEDKSKNEYTMELVPSGDKVVGSYESKGSSVDPNRKFKTEGVFRDLILRLTWEPLGDDRLLESGTLTMKYKEPGILVGHGLYYEPADEAIHTSTFEAKRRQV